MRNVVKAIIAVLVVTGWAACAWADVVSMDKLSRRYGAVGSYKALVIGIDAYNDSGIQGSKAAIAGAKKVSAALAHYAGFEVRSLYGAAADKESIMRELRVLSRAMGVGDSIVIYFSGSSRRDGESKKGWWLPVDASADDAEGWISGESLRESVNSMKARDVLLLSDAVLGDDLFGASHRLPSTRDDSYYLSMFNKRSRWGLTSGNLMPKAASGGVSVFAQKIVDAVGSGAPRLTMMEIYAPLKGSLRKAADLAPRCRSLRNTGDQGGEFVFLLEGRKAAAKVAAAPKPKPKKVAVAPKPAPVPVVKLTPPTPKPLPKKGRLNVASNIKGAEVMVDGSKMGLAPVKGMILNVGNHKIKVTKQGYLAWNGTVSISGGKSRQITASLKKEPPKTGTLFVTLKPESATLSLDGKPFKSGSTLKEGHYSLTVSAPLHAAKSVSVDVRAGREVWVEAFLSPVKSFKGDWGRYVYIPPGTFRMGSPSTEPRRKTDESPHPVTLSKGYFIQDREVTVSQWRRFVASTGYKSEVETKEGAYAMEEYLWSKSREYSWRNPGFKQADDHPVTSITYADTLAFVNWLNDDGTYQYRLPTEAEWEYAARAGKGEAFHTGPCMSSSDANVDANASWGDCPPGNASEGTRPVSSYASNSWGVFDMHGNVGEWCRDWYGAYATGSVSDPLGPTSGTKRVVRGGGWATYAYNARSANRSSQAPGDAYSQVGMRLVIDVPK